MAMQFWETKRRRRLYTLLYLVVFFILAIVVSFVFQEVANFFARNGYIPFIPYFGIGLFIFICLVSFFYYLGYKGFGGSMVAESMGGIELTHQTVESTKEAELLNIVEEIRIASRLPMPHVYLIRANEINAFAAGITPEKSAIAVTTGALNSLTRDELQGVIAHEFGHIKTGDMRLGLRLAALLMGFFLVFTIGLRLLEGSFFARGDGRKGNSLALIALLILLSGVILWFGGAVLRACVSRQREYMADASAVEFTRNPNGIASALKKIEVVNEKVRDMPKSGLSYAHLYLDNRSFWFRLFATHPPIDKRINAILGKKD